MPDLSDPLGPPKIVTGVDYMHALAALGWNVENMSSPLPVMSKIAQSMTSLIDTQYDNATKWQKSQADAQEAVARARYYDSDTNYNNASIDARVADVESQSKYRDALADQVRTNIPIDAQLNQQKAKENEFVLKEKQRQVDELDKAQSEFPAWHDELAQLDPTDPDYDNKVAAINAKYPEASTHPNTQRLISPLIQQQNVKRSQSSLVQQRTDQLNQLRGFQQNGLIPPDTDIQKGVAAGNGQSMINAAKKQGNIHRLQSITAYGSPSERLWAQGQIDQITGTDIGPDPTMFGANGDLNPGSEALLSTIERRIGITPVAPGAKKETKITTDETGTKTETTITGQPVTAQDITKPAQPTATTAMPTKPEDMQKDPIFQSVFSDLNAGKLVLPGNPKPGTPEFTAGLFAEYSKRKAAAAQPSPPGQAAQPSPSPAPAPAPQRASKAGRRGLSSTEEQGQEQAVAYTPIPTGANTSIATLQPDFADKMLAWEDGMRQAGYNPQIVQAGRSPSYQASLHEAYRSGRGPRAASAESSFHSYGRAFDWVNVGSDGTLQWNNDAAYEYGQKLASKYGLRGLGSADNDHLEDASFASYRDLPRNEYGRVATRGGTRTGTESATAFNANLPRPRTVEEAKALPPGTHFIDPDGNRRVAG